MITVLKKVRNASIRQLVLKDAYPENRNANERYPFYGHFIKSKHVSILEEGMTVSSRHLLSALVIAGLLVAAIVLCFWSYRPSEWETEWRKCNMSVEDERTKLGKVFVVNLDRRPDRWERIQKVLNGSATIKKLGFERVRATDGVTLPHRQMLVEGKLSKDAYSSLISNIEVNGEFLTMGGLGCLLSHAKIWERVAEMRFPALVLEDDIEIKDYFDVELDTLLDAGGLPLNQRFGLAYLANMVGDPVTKALQPFNNIVDRMLGAQWGTYAYIITPVTARILLRHLYPITQQADSYIIQVSSQAGIPAFKAKKDLVCTSNDLGRDSDVQRYKKEALTIPKIIHRIWLGEKELPRQARVYGTRWRALHPDWTVKLWTAQDIPSDLQLRGLVDRVNVTAMKSDILRYELLYRFGGVYVDVDVEPLKNIEPLLGGVEAFVGYEDSDNVCNAVIGSVPGHGLLHSLVKNIQASVEDPATSTVNLKTGPGYMLRHMPLRRAAFLPSLCSSHILSIPLGPK